MTSYHQSRATLIDKMLKNADLSSVFASESTPAFNPELLTPEEMACCHPMLDYRVCDWDSMRKFKALMLWLSYQNNITIQEHDKIVSLCVFYWLQTCKRTGLIDPNAIFVGQMKSMIQTTLLRLQGDLKNRVAQIGLDPKQLHVKDLCELPVYHRWRGKITEYSQYMNANVKEKVPLNLS